MQATCSVSTFDYNTISFYSQQKSTQKLLTFGKLFLTHDAAAEEDIVGGVDSAVAVQVGCKAFDAVGHYHAEYYAADDYIVGCIVFAVAVHISRNHCGADILHSVCHCGDDGAGRDIFSLRRKGHGAAYGGAEFFRCGHGRNVGYESGIDIDGVFFACEAVLRSGEAEDAGRGGICRFAV